MSLNRRFFAGVVAFCASTTAVGVAVGAGRRAGRASAASPPRRARRRSERERELKAAPSAKLAEADFDVMTAEPHHTGSPYEIKLADYVSDEFKKFGIEVDEVRIQRAAAVARPPPHRDRRARHSSSSKSRKKRFAATSGPTSQASCRRTTPIRPTATSPAKSST